MCDLIRQKNRGAVGNYDKETIRSVIRKNLAAVNACYRNGLVATPALQGRVIVQFTITPSGRVAESKVESSTLSHPEVEQCIIRATRQWVFPKAKKGGITIISYPFVRQPGTSPSSP